MQIWTIDKWKMNHNFSGLWYSSAVGGERSAIRKAADEEPEFDLFAEYDPQNLVWATILNQLEK